MGFSWSAAVFGGVLFWCFILIMFFLVFGWQWRQTTLVHELKVRKYHQSLFVFSWLFGGLVALEVFVSKNDGRVL